MKKRLNKFEAAKTLGVTRVTLDFWLTKKKMRKLLNPKVISLTTTAKFYFDEKRITELAKHIPPKVENGGRRIKDYDAFFEKVKLRLS